MSRTQHQAQQQQNGHPPIAPSSTTMTTTTPVPRTKIKIRPTHPTSTTSLVLLSSLDTEVFAMYPDADTFPWGFEGDWLRGVPEEQQGQSEEGDEGKLWVFVAETDTEAEAEVEVDGQKGATEEAGEVIGCVGVRVLPWFPLHRRPLGLERNGSVNGVVNRNGATTNGTASSIAINGTKPKAAAAAPKDGIRTAEIKRMFVVAGWRGKRGRRVVVVPPTPTTTTAAPDAEERSVAEHLLRHAETFAAQELKAQRMVLETGMRQVAAMGLYQRAGWVRREDFGDYVGAGEGVGGLSRCWEKWLV